MNIRKALGFLAFASFACNLTLTAEPSATSQPIAPTATSGEVAVPSDPVASITANIANPFPPVAEIAWHEGSYAGTDYAIPLDLSLIANPQVVAGLTDAQIDYLAQNGFVVIHSQEEQFAGLREQVSVIQGQPYFLTSDAAFHALHLTFDDLLKALEREELRPLMIDLLAGTLETMASYQASLAGTTLEGDAQRALAYLSVAHRLFDPEASLDLSVADLVERQLAQIQAGEGRDRSVILPDFEDDYGAYKPVGHYAGDPELEAYFQGMTWLGRVHFKLADENPSRIPLLATLALRQAESRDRPAVEAWTTIHEVLSFLIGPSDDAGPAEYSVLMDEVYGDAYGPRALADEASWEAFLGRSDELPAPQINSTFVRSLEDLQKELGWRYLGQRFTLDAFILQNLVFDKVKELDGVRRDLPSGLDVMAAFGSTAAQESLELGGETAFPNYPEQMALLRDAVQAQPEEQWRSRFYDSWLYAFFPVLDAKGDGFPSYMRSDGWAFKDLNAGLGSWAELKHDTVLYSKMPEGAGGGGPPCLSGPAPGYVEPNPVAFYRLASLAQTLAQGLEARGMGGSGYVSWGSSEGPPAPGLSELVEGMGKLGEQLQALGDISAKELVGEPLSTEDYATIQAPLGLAERLATVYGQTLMLERIPEVPIVAAVAGGGDQVLEAGTGYVDRILVVVPIGGRSYVAQGGIFSYYEFPVGRDQRLTDDEWRERLAGEPPPPLPAWSANFVLEGGSTVDWLAFRVGEVYAITEQGQDLNLRQAPALSGTVLKKLPRYEYVEIVGGPVEEEGRTWWNLRLCSTDQTGWAVEDQDWYERGWR